jgi:hypothetical protein
MTSDRQRAANRANAQRSTGPRSFSGKAIASQNALRHGLSSRLGEDPEQDQREEALAQTIAGPEAGSSELHYARTVSGATLQLTRIRALRATLMDPAAREREVFSWSMPKRVCWQRHYRARTLNFRSVADRAEQDPGDGSTFGERFFQIAAPLERIPPAPSGPEANTVILSRFIGEVLKLDRYERRELSRRKKALRALEALRTSQR